MSAMGDDIPEQPLEPDVFSEGPLHALRATSSGLALGPSNFPLYLGLFFLPFIPLLWYLTKDAEMDQGLKLAAWLFPVFASGGSIVGWALIRVIASKLVFDKNNRRLEFKGMRFRGTPPMPFERIMAIQVCYGGEKSFKGNTTIRSTIAVYELNVAYRDNAAIRRINLLCHGNHAALMEQARMIAAAIGVPRVIAGPVPSD